MTITPKQEALRMSSIWNNRISVSIFGESDGTSVGLTIDNLPPGEYIDADALMKFMTSRFPKSVFTDRLRTPSPRIISGIRRERTTGAPVCALIQNTEAHPETDDANVSKSAMPGHADYTGALRYRGFNDVKDLGKFSERLTAPLCFAGAICGQILERRGIYTGAHIKNLHNHKDNPFDPVNITRDGILSIRTKDFPVINDKRGWDMLEDMRKAGVADEALGGIVECACINVPAGIGSPVFDGLENNIAQLVFGIPAVKGIEFGNGFSSASMIGSQVKDEFYIDEHGHAVTKTNNHGGIIGGISSGMPVTLNVAFKPMSYTVSTGNFGALTVPSIVPSAVKCVEAAVNIALLSNMLDYPNFC